MRGDLMRGMNVYLLEEPGGGVTAFDSGTRPMAKAILKQPSASAASSGSCSATATPTTGCGALARGARLLPSRREAVRRKPTWRENAPYWDMDLLEVKSVHWLYEHWLHDRWDGGAVEIAGTVAEGDDVCGFEVKDLPGTRPA